MVDKVTTLPSMFVSIYARNELSKKSFGTQKNTLVSLRFFYVYYFKKYKRTFDYDFYQSNYNISTFIHDFDGFFNYLLAEQQLNDNQDTITFEVPHLTKANKVTYSSHIRHVGNFFRYLNFRYMNLRYQNMSPVAAHEINTANREDLAQIVKRFNSIEISKSEPANRYKSVTEQQNIDLNNMLIPSIPAFFDEETGEYIQKVLNPQNPFTRAFLQFRNYLMHRLMYNYGIRVGELLLISLDSVGETLPDARGNTRFILIIQNLPDDIVDPRRIPPSIKTVHSYRQIELTDDDFIILTIYMKQYRAPLFEKKDIDDHRIMFIKDRGNLDPISYDGIRSIYRDIIDPAFIALYPDYRKGGKENIDCMVKLTPHVGRHTWAYITLKFIYNEVLEESLTSARDYGIRARMNGELDAAVEKLRSLGGWSVKSKVPLKYASRFIELVSNESNKRRIRRSDWQAVIPESSVVKNEVKSINNHSENNKYDEEFLYDLFK